MRFDIDSLADIIPTISILIIQFLLKKQSNVLIRRWGDKRVQELYYNFSAMGWELGVGGR